MEGVELTDEKIWECFVDYWENEIPQDTKEALNAAIAEDQTLYEDIYAEYAIGLRALVEGGSVEAAEEALRMNGVLEAPEGY